MHCPGNRQAKQHRPGHLCIWGSLQPQFPAEARWTTGPSQPKHLLNSWLPDCGQHKMSQPVIPTGFTSMGLHKHLGKSCTSIEYAETYLLSLFSKQPSTELIPEQLSCIPETRSLNEFVTKWKTVESIMHITIIRTKLHKGNWNLLWWLCFFLHTSYMQYCSA